MKRQWLAICGLMLVGALIAGTLVCPQCARADVIKVIHIKNPFENANDRHDYFKQGLTVDEQEPNNPRATAPGNSGPSDVFAGGSPMDGNGGINFAGGTQTQNAVDNYRVKLKGPSLSMPTAANIVEMVIFTKDGWDIGYLYSPLDQPGDTDAEKARKEAQRKEFKQNIAGFTNEEYYDFSNLQDGGLCILNSEATLQLRYTLFDLKVYTNLPISNFTLDAYRDVGAMQPVYSVPQLVIEPGQGVRISLGALQTSTYVTASISMLRIEDLDTGGMLSATCTDFTTPQEFAETVPEPGSLLAFGSGLVCLGSIVSRRRL